MTKRSIRPGGTLRLVAVVAACWFMAQSAAIGQGAPASIPASAPAGVVLRDEALGLTFHMPPGFRRVPVPPQEGDVLYAFARPEAGSPDPTSIRIRSVSKALNRKDFEDGVKSRGGTVRAVPWRGAEALIGCIEGMNDDERVVTVALQVPAVKPVFIQICGGFSRKDSLERAAEYTLENLEGEPPAKGWWPPRLGVLGKTMLFLLGLGILGWTWKHYQRRKEAASNGNDGKNRTDG